MNRPARLSDGRVYPFIDPHRRIPPELPQKIHFGSGSAAWIDQVPRHTNRMLVPRMGTFPPARLSRGGAFRFWRQAGGLARSRRPGYSDPGLPSSNLSLKPEGKSKYLIGND